MIISHRGNGFDKFENTLDALVCAVTAPNVDGVEFDVQLTKDLVPIIFHDESFTSRTTDDRQYWDVRVSSVNYSELPRIKPHRINSGEIGVSNTIPTFEEFVAEIAKLDSVITAGEKTIYLDIELKECTDERVKQCYLLTKASMTTHLKDIASISYVFSSYTYSYTVVKFFEKHGEEFLINADNFTDVEQFMYPYDAVNCALDCKTIRNRRPTVIRMVKAYFTVNDLNVAKFILDKKADSWIITDIPLLLISSLG